MLAQLKAWKRFILKYSDLTSLQIIADRSGHCCTIKCIKYNKIAI